MTAGSGPICGPAGPATTFGVGGAPPSRSTCTAGVLDPVSGLVRCKEGFEHRPAAVACEVVGGAPAELEAGGAGGEPSSKPKPRAQGGVACAGNPSICDQFELGYCGQGPMSPVCLSGCITDADCGAGWVCTCHDYTSHGGECQPANGCRTDADCGPSLCAAYVGPCGDAGFACIQHQDQCVSDADCSQGHCAYGFIPAGGCTNLAFPARVCESSVCGRPFLVDSDARVACPVATGDWIDAGASRPGVEHLTREERAALAAHWTRMGQMEHASIAAFARFQLQLLALAAPPELVEGCTQALADETAHTLLCFGIASAYAGSSIGPGPLDIDGSLACTSLADVVDLVIAEGCYGETGAALEALEAADAASDPVIFAAYARIARDEQRHAELAFRFVRWAAGQDERVATRVRAALVAGQAVSPAVQDIVESCLYAVLTQRAAA